MNLMNIQDKNQMVFPLVNKILYWIQFEISSVFWYNVSVRLQ